MLVKLVEVFRPEGDRLYLDEIHVSPDAVKMIRKETNVNMINEAHALGIVSNAASVESPFTKEHMLGQLRLLVHQMN